MYTGIDFEAQDRACIMDDIECLECIVVQIGPLLPKLLGDFRDRDIG